MKTEETTNPHQSESTPVQHDSETPLPQKPSFLFIVSTSLGVLTILILAASAYYGIAR